MSSSASTAGQLIKRAKRTGMKQRYHDGLTDAEFKRRVEQGWRESLINHGIDPDTQRRSNFEQPYGKKLG